MSQRPPSPTPDFLATARAYAIAVLGPPGRCLSGSKTSYRLPVITRKVYFNANLCIEGGNIWQGDLDLMLPHDQRRLQEVANHFGTPVYVVPE